MASRGHGFRDDGRRRFGGDRGDPRDDCRRVGGEGVDPSLGLVRHFEHLLRAKRRPILGPVSVPINVEQAHISKKKVMTVTTRPSPLQSCEARARDCDCVQRTLCQENCRLTQRCLTLSVRAKGSDGVCLLGFEQGRAEVEAPPRTSSTALPTMSSCVSLNGSRRRGGGLHGTFLRSAERSDCGCVLWPSLKDRLRS